MYYNDKKFYFYEGSIMTTNDNLISGVLSDTAIRKYWNNGIFIQTEHKTGQLAFNIDEQLQPGSIDLRFRNNINRIKLKEGEVLSFDRIKNKDYLSPDVVPTNGTLLIQPNEIILTTTLESIFLSDDFAGIITGRSSFARLGLMVQCCQDFINPGLKNSVALQLINVSPYPIELNINIPICQLVIVKMVGTPSEGYNDKNDSKYKGETDFLGSEIYKEIDSADATSNDTSKNNDKNIFVFLHKYIEPLLPSLVMLLIITPIVNSVSNINILQVLGKLSVYNILIVIVFALYIILKRRGDK